MSHRTVAQYRPAHPEIDGEPSRLETILQSDQMPPEPGIGRPYAKEEHDFRPTPSDAGQTLMPKSCLLLYSLQPNDNELAVEPEE
jgi:hypothetical protein